MPSISLVNSYFNLIRPLICLIGLLLLPFLSRGQSVSGRFDFTTVDGTGTNAQFSDPKDASGNLFIADFKNHRVRKITTASVSLKGDPVDQAGNHNVTLTANDSGGGTATKSFTITVADKTGPTATIAIDNLDLGASETGQVTVSFNEAVKNFTNDDVSIPNGTLSPVSSADGGKTFTATYTPANGIESTTNVITVDLTEVEDQSGNTGIGTVSTENFSVDTKAPVFTSAPAVEFVENSSGIAYSTQATDQSTVTFGKASSNDGARFNVAENGQVSFNSVPDFESPQDNDQDNIYLLEVTATDEKGNTAALTVAITVTNVNDNPPLITSEPIIMANEEGAYIYNIRASDPDGDALSFTGSFPAWLSLGANQGMQVTTIAGSYQSTFTDGAGTDASFSSPHGIDVDSDGNVWVADYVHNRIRKIAPAGEVSTLAGSGRPGYEDGFQDLAAFNRPSDLVVDAAGNIYVTDELNYAIRKITSVGLVSTFAGGNGSGMADGPGTIARFGEIRSIDIDTEGNLYVADKGNRKIRKISPEGEVSTLAGSGNLGSADGTGTIASFGSPEGITLDNLGNIYVADGYARNVRKINAAGEVTTLAGSGSRETVDGTGTGASFFNLNGIDADDQGNIYVAEFSRGTIRKITSQGVVTSVVGGNSGVDAVYSALGLAWVPGGTIYASDAIGNHIYKLRPDNVIELIAGGGTGELNNGDLQEATLNVPHDLVVHQPSGNIFFTDRGNHVIRKISPDGQVSTFAGSGTAGYADGSAGLASFDSPYGLAMNSSGFLFVADLRNNRIRMIDADGNVSTFVGSGDGAFADGTGTLASFNSPRDLTIDKEDNLYISDMFNARIRKVSPSGVVTTLAGSGAWNFTDGTGTEAAFVQPMGLSLDADGNLYVADQGNNRIRKITQQGVVTTFAGSGSFQSQDGTGTNASFASPVNVLVDESGNIYVAENNRIRLISSEGDVSTFAGSGLGGATDGVGTNAALGGPSGLAFNAEGDILVAEAGNHLIRKISVPGVSLTGDPTGQIGEHNMTLTVSDGGGNTDQQDFVITITDNTPPYFVSQPVTLVELNATYEYKVQVEDPDNDAFTVSAPVLPGWLSLNSQTIITTIAGGNGEVFRDGTGTNAGFRDPRDIVLDSKGNAYIADGRAHVIRKVDKEGVVTTFAGMLNNPGVTEGTGTQAQLANPIGLAIDADDNIYVASAGYFSTPSTLIYKAVQKISPHGAVSLIAGGFKERYEDGTGTDAAFTYPNALTRDNFGNIYMVDNLRIRKITSEGIVTTLAGNGRTDGINGTGTQASFDFYPEDVVTDEAGNVYVADGDRIKIITPEGVMTTFAGFDGRGYADGPLAEAQFSRVGALSRDEEGNIYVGDGGNYRIRKIDVNGMVTTIAGLGSFGQVDGPVDVAFLNPPTGLFVQNRNTLFMVDHVKESYRKIELQYNLEGAPGNNFGDHNVKLIADDGKGGLAEQSFKITSSPESTPVFISGTSAAFEENATGPAYTGIAEDANPQAVLSYSLASGLDATLFSIESTTGIISFLSPPDFENPNDGDQDNRYELEVRVQNGNSNGPGGLKVIIQVTNQPDIAPEFISDPVIETGDNTAYKYDIEVSDGDMESVLVTSGVLPDWLSLTPENEVSTLAGNGAKTVVNGSALSASFQDLKDLVTDSKGNMYVSDGTAHLIRKIDVNGQVSDFVGLVNTAGLSEGTGTEARLAHPLGLGIDAMDNIYVAMSGYSNAGIRFNTAIGKITPEGRMTVLAGGGRAAYLDGTGTSARFEELTGLVADPSGNVYVLDNGKVRMVDTDGVVTTREISSNTSLTLNSASDLTVDSHGDLFFVHAGSNAVSSLNTNGQFRLLAGNGQTGSADGTGFDARFNFPLAIGIDDDDLLYVAEQGSPRIRTVDENGVVTTLAGSGTAGYLNGPGATARFSGILGLFVKKDGSILLAENTNALIRQISRSYRLSGNPFGQTGDHNIELTASDPGGDSDQQNFTITVNDVSGPVFTSGTTADFVENSTGVAYQAMATDPSGVSYSLGNSLDEALFTISDNGELSFLSPPNFESPADGNSNNVYVLAIIATDGYDNTTTLNLEVSVTDILEADPIILSTPVTTINEGDDYTYAVKAMALGEGIDFNTSLPSWLSISALEEGKVETLAGSGISSFQEGSGTEASFDSPSGMDLDAEGNLYVADNSHHRIRKITPDGIVSTVAGSGRAGYLDGTGTDAMLNYPTDLVLDDAGNIYFVESKNYGIRKISTDGVVSTIAGGSEIGYMDGAGSQARFGSSRAIAIDSKSNLVVSDLTSYSIRIITPEGVVSTLAGSGSFGSVNGLGTNASFFAITGIALDAGDNIYVAEQTNGAIRKISPQGMVSAFAGPGESETQDGTGTMASFSRLGFLEADNDGNLYVTESFPARVRKITSAGVVTTILGEGSGADVSALDEEYRAYGIAKGSLGDIFLSDTRNDIVYKLSGSGTTSVVAGGGYGAYQDGNGANATFRFPRNTAVDAVGNIYVVDALNHVIRKITTDGEVSTFAGSGTYGDQDGTGTNASFWSPWDILINPEGVLYVSDLGSAKIKKITPEGVVSTFVGAGTAGFADGSGTDAMFTSPNGMDWDAEGNIYLSESFQSSRIRKITPEGVVSTLAGSGSSGYQDGTGTEASFSQTLSVAVGPDENIYVADDLNKRVRKITPEGVVTTFAGSGSFKVEDGSGTEASFLGLRSLTFDPEGNLYVADRSYIRVISPQGEVKTIAGSATQGALDANGTNASFGTTLYLEADGLGGVIIVDYANHLIRRLNLAGLKIMGNSLNQAGDHDISISITDENGKTAEQDFVLKVIAAPVPVFTSPETADFAENGTAVAYQAVAAHSTALVYSLGTGNDESLFNIDGTTGEITFRTPPDFENPGDSDNNNQYVIEVKAGDGIKEASQLVTVSVTDQAESIAPVFTSVPVTEVDLGATYQYDILTSDEDLDRVIVTSTTLPGWLTLNKLAVVSTIAGSGDLRETDGSGTNASFGDMGDVVTDSQGNIFVAGRFSQTIRKITPEGAVTTFAGIPYNPAWQDGTGTDAQLNTPVALAIDDNDNLYVSQSSPFFNTAGVSKITPNAVVTLIAGGGTNVHQDGTGTTAGFKAPAGITADGEGNLYLTDEHRIRKIDTDGVVTTIAGAGSGSANGTGTEALFNQPKDITIDSQGNLYVVDNGNSQVRKITQQGVVTTFASAPGVLRWPSSIGIDAQDNLFVSNGYNDTEILKIDSQGTISRIAGNSGSGFQDGEGTNALFWRVAGLFVDKRGNVYIADSENRRVRVIEDRYRLTGDASGQVGEHPVVLQAEDTNGATAQQSFIVKALDESTPVLVSPSTVTFIENQTGPVYTIRGTDTNPNAVLTYSLGDRFDEAFFNIDPTTGVVTFKSAPDYETPLDQNANNYYIIEVLVTNQDDNASPEQKVAIAVLNESDEDPVFSTDPLTTADEDVLYRFDISVKDQDGDGLTVTAGTLPDWLSLTNETVVTTIAGNGSSTHLDGTGTLASFFDPVSVVMDSQGNLYVADGTGHTVRKVDQQGIVSTFAGTAYRAGLQDGTGTEARLARPVDLAIDAEDNIYVSQNGYFTGTPQVRVNAAVSKISPQGVVTLLAGGGTAAHVDGMGSAARFESPADLVLSSEGDIYLLDYGSFRKIDGNGQVTTLDFSDFNAGDYDFGNVSDMTIDVQGNLFLTVPAKHVVMKLSQEGFLSVFAGNGSGASVDGMGTNAGFNSPFSITTDAEGNFYVGNQLGASLRKISPGGMVTTLAGGTTGFQDGTGTNARFYGPSGLFATDDGNIYVADNQNDRIRKASTSLKLHGVASDPGDYSVNLTVSDGSGGTAEQAFTIRVNDVTKPVFTSGTAVDFAENGTGIAYTAEATDYQSVAYGLGTENDERLFSINEISGEINFTTVPDFENPTDGDGNNEYVIQVRASDGTNETIQLVTITVTDVEEDTTPPAKPVITGISDDTGSSDSDGVTKDKNIVIYGTAEPNAMVEVSHQFGPLRSVQADTNGDWLLDITDIRLIEFVVDLKAEAIDLAGNRSEKSDVFVVTPDFTAPAKPVITGISYDTGSSDSDGVTKDKNIIIYGTAEPNTTVEVSHQFGPFRSVQADTNGDWLLDITDIRLIEFVVDLKAEAIDLAGNRSEKSDVFVVTPDFTAPAKPVITGISDDTGSSDSDGVTKDKNIIIYGTAEPNTTVEVSHQFGPLRSVQADTNGDWLLDITDIRLIEFVVDLKAEAIDLAGNRSETSDVFVVTPDFTAPAKPVITGISDDTGSSDSDGVTKDKNIIIYGTAEPNTTVEVSHQFGPLRSVQADTNGDWLLDITDITLIEFVVDLKAAAIDLAGNRSESSNVFVVTPDFTAPGVVINTERITSAGHTIKALFDEEVSGLTLEEISVTGGTASNLVQTSAASYTFLVSISGSTADVRINAGAAQDVAGNDNHASDQLTLNVTVTSAGEGFNRLPDLNKTEEVRIYPNPASKLMTIDLSELSAEEVDVHIYNAAGISVFRQEAFEEKTLQIDVSDFTSGIYIVQLYDGIRIIRKKVVVKK